MPYISMRETKTPLAFFGVRIFREVESNRFWIKIGKGQRHRLCLKIAGKIAVKKRRVNSPPPAAFSSAPPRHKA